MGFAMLRFVILGSSLLCAQSALAQQYALTDLDHGEAAAINAAGQVVGFTVESGSYRAFVWTDGTMQTLGNA
jgi:probable HAF family extracellular repeat protein